MILSWTRRPAALPSCTPRTSSGVTSSAAISFTTPVNRIFHGEMNERQYDICDLLEARASSDRDAFLISKTIFTKIATGSTAPRQP